MPMSLRDPGVSGAGLPETAATGTKAFRGRTDRGSARAVIPPGWGDGGLGRETDGFCESHAPIPVRPGRPVAAALRQCLGCRVLSGGRRCCPPTAGAPAGRLVGGISASPLWPPTPRVTLLGAVTAADSVSTTPHGANVCRKGRNAAERLVKNGRHRDPRVAANEHHRVVPQLVMQTQGPRGLVGRGHPARTGPGLGLTAQRNRPIPPSRRCTDSLASPTPAQRAALLAEPPATARTLDLVRWRACRYNRDCRSALGLPASTQGHLVSCAEPDHPGCLCLGGRTPRARRESGARTHRHPHAAVRPSLRACGDVSRQRTRRASVSVGAAGVSLRTAGVGERGDASRCKAVSGASFGQGVIPPARQGSRRFAQDEGAGESANVAALRGGVTDGPEHGARWCRGGRKGDAPYRLGASAEADGAGYRAVRRPASLENC